MVVLVLGSKSNARLMNITGLIRCLKIVMALSYNRFVFVEVALRFKSPRFAFVLLKCDF